MDRITKKNWTNDVPDVDSGVIIAMALNEDYDQLYQLANIVRPGSCMICANPEYNFCDYAFIFMNAGVTINVKCGMKNKYVWMINTYHFCMSRHRPEDEFKVEPRHLAKYGFSVTPEGRWLKDGEDFVPQYY